MKYQYVEIREKSNQLKKYIKYNNEFKNNVDIVVINLYAGYDK